MTHVPIRTSTLRPDTPFGFDVFLQLKSKMILYIRNGDDINNDRLGNLRKKKVRQMFILEEHEEKYQDFLDQGLLEASSNVMMSSEQKAGLVEGYTSQAVDQVYEDPASEKSQRHAQKAAKGLIEIVGKNDDVLKELINKTLVNTDGEAKEILIRHGVNVSSLIARFGEILGVDDETLEQLSMAGMFHDISISKIDDGAASYLITKREDQFTPDDWVLYKRHPEESANFLQEGDRGNDLVVDFVLKHEEKRSGDGFPKGTKKLSANQEMFNMCCFYSRLVSCLGFKCQEALTYMIENEDGNFDKQMLDRFGQFVKDEGIDQI